MSGISVLIVPHMAFIFANKLWIFRKNKKIPLHRSLWLIIRLMHKKRLAQPVSEQFPFFILTPDWRRQYHAALKCAPQWLPAILFSTHPFVLPQIRNFTCFNIDFGCAVLYNKLHIGRFCFFPGNPVYVRSGIRFVTPLCLIANQQKAESAVNDFSGA